MSVTLPTTVVLVHAVALVILSALLVSVLVLFVRLRQLRAPDANRAALEGDTAPGEDIAAEMATDEAEADEMETDEAPPDEAALDEEPADAFADSVRAIEAAAAEAANDHLARRWDELVGGVAADLKTARIGADHPPVEPAALTPPSSEDAPACHSESAGDQADTPEWDRVRGTGATLEPPRGDVGYPDEPPAQRRGVQLSRPASQDVFAEACEWLTVLGLAGSEMERLRSAAEGREPAGAVRKLFGTLHHIAAERRLADDRPSLNWQRVPAKSLERFVGKFHPGIQIRILWPAVGERFDPRTMHILQKDESGRGVVTEVIAPGYATEADRDPVKALIIY